MLYRLIIKPGKNSLVNLLCFRNVFHSSKTKQLVNLLRQQLSQHKISAQKNHNNFMQLINDDIRNNYDEYTNVKSIFQSYVKQVTSNTKFNQYNPEIIKQQGIRMSEIMKAISNYPKFQLQKQSIRHSYQIFCRFLNYKTDQQLSKALLFALKADKRAQESVLYNQFLKFYLDEPWQTLKAKYQLNLKSESIGNFIKKILGSITHRGFLRRSPSYDRVLKLHFPTRVLANLIQNPSTNESLLIRKVMYEQIFTPMVTQFESILQSNLYNDKNTRLWSMLNENIYIIFSGNKLVQKQCEYLRQLYVTLFLMLRQKQKDEFLRHRLPQICTAYGYVKEHYDSAKSKQFIESVSQFAAQFGNGLAGEHAHALGGHKLGKYFPELASAVVQAITNKLSPLTFSVYFGELCELLPCWSPSLIAKIVASQQNMFNYITFQQCLDFLARTRQNNTNTQVSDSRVGLYNAIVDSIVDRQYKQQPTIPNIITILQIYQHHQQLPTSNSNNNLELLRLFLFRFISDNKHRANKKQLQQIIAIVLDLDDSATFADELGNYSLNIYEELAAVADAKFVYTDLKQRLKQKANIRQEAYSESALRIKEYLGRMAK